MYNTLYHMYIHTYEGKKQCDFIRLPRLRSSNPYKTLRLISSFSSYTFYIHWGEFYHDTIYFILNTHLITIYLYIVAMWFRRIIDFLLWKYTWRVYREMGLLIFTFFIIMSAYLDLDQWMAWITFVNSHPNRRPE